MSGRVARECGFGKRDVGLRAEPITGVCEYAKRDAVRVNATRSGPAQLVQRSVHILNAIAIHTHTVQLPYLYFG